MRETLDLARRRRRRRWPWVAVAAMLCLCLPSMARGADRLLAAHYTGERAALEAENAALHAELAEASGMAAENEALRALLGSERTEGSWLPLWVAARWPGGFALAGEAAPGAPVVDRYGRYAGEVTASWRGISTVQRGAPAGLAGDAMGILQGDVLTGLPRHSGLTSGSVVATPSGQWLGRLAADPTADPDGLTEHAALEDTADMEDLLYFVQQ